MEINVPQGWVVKDFSEDRSFISDHVKKDAEDKSIDTHVNLETGRKYQKMDGRWRHTKSAIREDSQDFARGAPDIPPEVSEQASGKDGFQWTNDEGVTYQKQGRVWKRVSKAAPEPAEKKEGKKEVGSSKESDESLSLMQRFENNPEETLKELEEIAKEIDGTGIDANALWQGDYDQQRHLGLLRHLMLGGKDPRTPEEREAIDKEIITRGKAETADVPYDMEQYRDRFPQLSDSEFWSMRLWCSEKCYEIQRTTYNPEAVDKNDYYTQLALTLNGGLSKLDSYTEEDLRKLAIELEGDDSALKHLREDGTTIRGITVDDPEEFILPYMQALEEGGEYTEPGFLATSRLNNDEMFFDYTTDANITYVITPKKENSQGKLMDHWKRSNFEAEVLYPAGSKHKINDIVITELGGQDMTTYFSYSDPRVSKMQELIKLNPELRGLKLSSFSDEEEGGYEELAVNMSKTHSKALKKIAKAYSSGKVPEGYPTFGDDDYYENDDFADFLSELSGFSSAGKLNYEIRMEEL